MQKYVCIYGYKHGCVYVYMCIYAYIYMYVSLSAYMYICTYTWYIHVHTVGSILYLGFGHIVYLVCRYTVDMM